MSKRSCSNFSKLKKRSNSGLPLHINPTPKGSCVSVLGLRLRHSLSDHDCCHCSHNPHQEAREARPVSLPLGI
ncbi:hypothetical protein GBA52_025328 [Prunus armeniaca]|nr:hypothetical protein GBA52_025328 [Prunus armeniaca]